MFSLGTNGSGFQNVLSFTGSGGASPGGVVFSSLVLIGTNLYGTTWNEGSANNCGSIFCIGTNGSGFQSLLAFTGTGGAYPGAGPRDLSVASASAIDLGSLGNATVISGGSAVLSATLTNSATSSTLYGMTQSGGRSDDGTIYSLTVPSENNLNYTLAAATRSGSAILGTVTPVTGSLASGGSQSCTVSATSTNLGVNTIALTAGDPNSSNLSQTATATLTVLDHAAAAFANGNPVLTLNFGTLQVGSGTQSRPFQIENLPAAFREGWTWTPCRCYSMTATSSAPMRRHSPTWARVP